MQLKELTIGDQLQLTKCGDICQITGIETPKTFPVIDEKTFFFKSMNNGDFMFTDTELAKEFINNNIELHKTKENREFDVTEKFNSIFP